MARRDDLRDYYNLKQVKLELCDTFQFNFLNKYHLVPYISSSCIFNQLKMTVFVCAYNVVTVERFRLPHAQLCLRDRRLLTTMHVAKVNDQSGYVETTQQERLLQLTRYSVNRFNYNGVC